jgi:hypothetical protein
VTEGGSTRGKINAALPPDICAFGDHLYHRSEPDWHFSEKPIQFVDGLVREVVSFLLALRRAFW